MQLILKGLYVNQGIWRVPVYTVTPTGHNADVLLV